MNRQSEFKLYHRRPGCLGSILGGLIGLTRHCRANVHYRQNGRSALRVLSHGALRPSLAVQYLGAQFGISEPSSVISAH
jgi:hypothetical protein